MFTIPSEVFTNYFEVCDELIRNPAIGENITVFYTETIAVNDGNLNFVNGPSTNIGPDGNLLPFNKRGGTGTKQVENSTTIRVRWYPDPKDWKRIGIQVFTTDVKVIAIGLVSDINKIRQCSQIGHTFGGVTTRYMPTENPEMWGFKQNGEEKYWVLKLKAA